MSVVVLDGVRSVRGMRDRSSCWSQWQGDEVYKPLGKRHRQARADPGRKKMAEVGSNPSVIVHFT